MREEAMTEKMEDMRAAVAAGVELLDTKRPGWWREIDVAELKMKSCSQCVVGQLFCNPKDLTLNYGYGLGKLNIMDGRDFGFDIDTSDLRFESERTQRWDGLRELWVEVIKQRWDEGFDV